MLEAPDLLYGLWLNIARVARSVNRSHCVAYSTIGEVSAAGRTILKTDHVSQWQAF